MNFRFIFAAFLAGTFVAGSTSTPFADAGHVDRNAVGSPGEVDQVTRTINVDMTDNEFSVESLEVNPGETIRFIVSNSGVFLHEFNIGTKSMHISHQEEMMSMMDKGMMTTEKMMMPMAHNDPNSRLIEPGESAEIIWTFPETADLEFACNVPGHYESGMVGNIRIDS